MRFSQRIGKTPIKVELQTSSMDDDLRIALWNAFDLFFLRSVTSIERFRVLFQTLWFKFFKRPLDTLDEHTGFSHALDYVRDRFFKWEWYEVYDFMEFVAQIEGFPIDTAAFRQFCNSVLEQELSGYRFVDTQIAPITNEEELKEIEEAIEITGRTKLSGVHAHLKSAVSKLSDRKNPDYRNSIKESISAVESISQVIAGNPKAELGQALKVIEDKIGLHPALKKGFLAIYGYTSDADGIRHAMTDESKCDFEDAKYMLVSCSAFINYLIMKATKVGIKF